MLRRNPVRIRQGDLTRDLASLLTAAPTGPTIVVFHAATPTYVSDPDERAAFATTLCEHSAVWGSNVSVAPIPHSARVVWRAALGA